MQYEKIRVKKLENGEYNILKEIRKKVFNSGKVIEVITYASLKIVKTFEEVVNYLEKEV